MTLPIKKIVIVGGGTAGWLTAGILASEYDLKDSQNFQVVLIESPDIPTIGVGEGTWPSMKNTLKKIGVSETDFFRECDASFKQGSKFVDWTRATGDHYYHPFTLPEKFNEINLAEYWLPFRDKISFGDSIFSQAALSDLHLAPKLMSTPEYAGIVNYGYHLDAGKFSNFLKKHCIEKLGITYIADNVVNILSADSGDIAAVVTKNNGAVAGDLFIDCTGFSSLLLGKHFGIGVTSVRNVLFNDTALAVQVPYVNSDTPIESCTLGTAQTSGWVWDIGLPTRRGVGHVYSSAHMSDDQADASLRKYLSKTVAAKDIEQLSPRKISFNPGYREKLWHKNCVAVGIAAGFIEPLEATALVLIELSAQFITEQLPSTRSQMDIVAKQFNEKFAYRWTRIIDFLKLHYVLTERTDSDYWVDHKAKNSIPDSLVEQMEIWRYRCPWRCDNYHLDEMFPFPSYQCVLYGMQPSFSKLPIEKRNADQHAKIANDIFKENAQLINMLRGKLISNRELLKRLQEYRFHKI